ncbi:MAG: hypothetical protein AAFQ98_07825 [Bacteroidota bacterium]
MKHLLPILFLTAMSLCPSLVRAQWSQQPGILSTTNKVGVGTNSPQGKLHVSGGSLVLDNQQSIVFLDPNGAFDGNVLFRYQNASYRWKYTGQFWFQALNNLHFVVADSAGQSVFNVHPATRLVSLSAAIQQDQGQAYRWKNASGVYDGTQLIRKANNSLLWSYANDLIFVPKPGANTVFRDDANQPLMTLASDTAGVAFANAAAGPFVSYINRGTQGDWSLRTASAQGTMVFQDHGGTMAVGTAQVPAGYTMAVDGKIMSEELTIRNSTTWPDYVFAEDYPLMAPREIAQFIEEHHHLPGVPSAAQVAEDGVAVGEMQAILLEKIEELTLLTIQLHQQVTQQQAELEAMKATQGQ